MVSENTPVLESKRLILRKFSEDDIDDMILLYGDEEVNTFLPWFPIKTRAEAEEYLHSRILPCYQKDVYKRQPDLSH